MTPLTRKENYLNEIVGWGNTAPEKPTTPEEFFFAAILGEAVQAPDLSNASRYELFLAKIAGYNVNISPPTYTSPRLEFFLAKAAGMDVVTPVPLTKEEIFWSNYSAIVELEVEGVPPLTYKAIEGTLENYKIYGNTVGGESVGDLVESGEHAGEYKVPVTVEGKNLFDKDNANIIKGYFSSSGFNTNSASNRTIYIPCLPDTVYTITKAAQSLSTNNRFRICTTTEIPTNNTAVNDYVFLPDGTRETTLSITTTSNAVYLFCFIYFNNTNSADSDFEEFLKSVQIEYGSSSSSYEPYHAPVTTPIYLPEPIKMVGDEAEYIDYAEQKMHRIGADDINVTLPELPTLTGTNVLSVGTAVQPSKVYVKYKGERQ